MSDYSHPDVLVSTDFVLDHLDDPGIVIAEVDVDTTSYEEGHISGAVGWNWHTQLCDTTLREIIGKRKIEQLLGQSGISNDTTVILYGDNNNWFAAWAYWQLVIYGHQNVKIMDGGRKKWLIEGKPLSTEPVTPVPTEYHASDPDFSHRAYMGDVRSALGSDVALVDVRSADEFAGRILAPPGLPETCQRGGHIPGAANIGWGLACNEDGTFKTREELEQIYGSRGVTPDKRVFVYCRIGERSSHSWFALKYLLGYPNVQNYDGSWTEWGNLVGAPIETGD